MPETEIDTSTPKRLTWRVAEVAKIVDETPRVKSLVLDVPGWAGHRPGQHVDVRLTAEDGYQAQRSYSVASEPENARLRLGCSKFQRDPSRPCQCCRAQIAKHLDRKNTGTVLHYFGFRAVLAIFECTEVRRTTIRAADASKASGLV